jgi:hypothetical protein
VSPPVIIFLPLTFGFFHKKITLVNSLLKLVRLVFVFVVGKK